MTLGPPVRVARGTWWTHEAHRFPLFVGPPCVAMCIAAPGRVLALDDGTAVVEVAGRRRRASLLMTPDVEIGAWVLVAAGNVVRRIDASEASELESLLAPAMVATAPRPKEAQHQSHRPGGST